MNHADKIKLPSCHALPHAKSVALVALYTWHRKLTRVASCRTRVQLSHTTTPTCTFTPPHLSLLQVEAESPGLLPTAKDAPFETRFKEIFGELAKSEPGRVPLALRPELHREEFFPILFNQKLLDAVRLHVDHACAALRQHLAAICLQCCSNQSWPSIGIRCASQPWPV